MKHLRTYAEKLTAAQKVDSYYIIFNLLLWVGAFAVFYYELDLLPNAIAHIAAAPAANSSPRFFGPAYIPLDPEQRILIYFTALKYCFWIFFFISIRTAALLFRQALTFLLANGALITAFILAVLLTILARPLDEYTWSSLGGRQWVFFFLLVVMPSAILGDLAFLLLVLVRKKKNCRLML